MKKKLATILLFVLLFSSVCTPAFAEGFGLPNVDLKGASTAGDFEGLPQAFTEITQSGASDALSFNIELSKNKFVYDGKVKTPAVTVKDKSGNVVSDKLYTVTYSDGRKNVGAYSVTVEFKLVGLKQSSSFTIVPKSTPITKRKSIKKGFKLNWKKLPKKQLKQISGYEIQYSTSKNFANVKKSVKVKGANKTTKTVKKLKAKKKYYVRIRTYKTVGGKAYYSAWSKTKAVKTK